MYFLKLFFFSHLYALYLRIIIVISVNNSYQTLGFHCESCASVPRFRSEVTLSVAALSDKHPKPHILPVSKPSFFFF